MEHPVAHSTSPRAGGPDGQLAALVALLGWAVAAALAAWIDRSEARAAAGWPAAPASGTTPRRLRAAEGVGERRALDVARFLWVEGEDADVTRLHGIGERTAREIRRALRAPGTR